MIELKTYQLTNKEKERVVREKPGLISILDCKHWWDGTEWTVGVKGEDELDFVLFMNPAHERVENLPLFGELWINACGSRRLVLLNTSILTAYGIFEYIPITPDLAKAMYIESANKQLALSAIGHQTTCDVINALWNSCETVKMNRITYRQKRDDICLVFKLNGRPEEGKILTCEEIEKIGYSWGIIQEHAIGTGDQAFHGSAWSKEMNNENN